MPDVPDRVTEPLDRDAPMTGEIGSEGGSPGDLLMPPGRPGPAGSATERRPRLLPAALWWALAAPVVVVLLWFATSAASC